MAYQFLRLTMYCIVAVSCFVPATSQAARPSEELLPNTTKAYLSIPHLDQLNASWKKTQLGALMNDPVMKPFAEDLERQLKAKFSQSGVRLGVTIEDLSGIASGEVCVASLQPGGDKTRCATVLLADVTGNGSAAEGLIAKISKNLSQKGATAGTADIGGVAFAAYKLPKKKPTDRMVTAYFALHADLLWAGDDPEVLGQMLGRLSGGHADSLRALTAYSQIKRNVVDGLKTEPHVKWFVEPFGYVEVTRAYQGGRKKRGTDMLKVLASQGFNAIQGLGGVVTFATGPQEILHHSYVYAPPVKRPAGDNSKDKYNLAARMLDFPNQDSLQPAAWIPHRLGTFLTISWKLQNAFWNSESLVNEVAGDEVFKDVIKSIETDANGPRINVEREFVKFLGERVTIISDYREPIDTKSERVLFAVEVTDPETVLATVNKAMKSDPNAKRIMVDGHTIWEMTQEETFAVEVIQIDGADFAPADSDQDSEEENEERKFRPNAAVTVAHGHLLVATHVDYLVDLLKQPSESTRLTMAPDFQRMEVALKDLGARSDSFRLFTRTDHAYRVTYEMVRENKMPESESLLGKALNEILAPDEEDTLREQELDGSKLPPFEQIQKYLGPTGLYVRTMDDGWSVTGCLLSRPAP